MVHNIAYLASDDINTANGQHSHNFAKIICWVEKLLLEDKFIN